MGGDILHDLVVYGSAFQHVDEAGNVTRVHPADVRLVDPRIAEDAIREAVALLMRDPEMMTRKQYWRQGGSILAAAAAHGEVKLPRWWHR